MVIGTQALAAYEFAAGFLSRLPRPRLLVGAGSRLTLRPRRDPPADLLARLHRVDRSFRPFPAQGLSPSNKTGFRLSFLSPPTARASHG